MRLSSELSAKSLPKSRLVALTGFERYSATSPSTRIFGSVISLVIVE
jgi:hypothetical protein